MYRKSREPKNDIFGDFMKRRNNGLKLPTPNADQLESENKALKAENEKLKRSLDWSQNLEASAFRAMRTSEAGLAKLRLENETLKQRVTMSECTVCGAPFLRAKQDWDRILAIFPDPE